MNIERFKQLSIPKIEAGKITEVVRDVIKVQEFKLLSKMCTNKRRRNLSQEEGKYKRKLKKSLN